MQNSYVYLAEIAKYCRRNNIDAAPYIKDATSGDAEHLLKVYKDFLNNVVNPYNIGGA